MLQLTTNMNVPSVAACKTILTSHNREFGIPLDFDRLLEYYSYYTLSSNKRKRTIAKYIGFGSVDAQLKDAHMLEFFKKAGVSRGLQTTKQGAVSFSADALDAIVETGLYSPEICKIITGYKLAKQEAKYVDTFWDIIRTHPVDTEETYDNHRMIRVRPLWVPQNTNRLGLREPALHNVNRLLKDIFTVPKGYRFMECDSGQIEPRIIQSYFINDPLLKQCTLLYNDAYYGYLHYCTILTDEERNSGKADLVPMEITDELKERRQTFKTYGNAVMYGSTENRAKDKVKDSLIRYIGQHPKRNALVSDIQNRLDRGQTSFPTAFGTPIDITKSDKLKGMTDPVKIRDEMVTLAINNPVQGTAADLMRFSIKKADDLLFDKAPKSHILKYTHDSGTFAIHEDEYDLVADELRTITAYQVDDWVPIYSDPIEAIKCKSPLSRLIA